METSYISFEEIIALCSTVNAVMYKLLYKLRGRTLRRLLHVVGIRMTLDLGIGRSRSHQRLP